MFFIIPQIDKKDQAYRYLVNNNPFIWSKWNRSNRTVIVRAQNFLNHQTFPLTNDHGSVRWICPGSLIGIFFKKSKNTNASKKAIIYKPTHPKDACIIAAIGPDKMRGSVEKATNIENCVAVKRLSTNCIK